MHIEVKFTANPHGGVYIAFETEASKGCGMLRVTSCLDIPEKDMAITEINRGILMHLKDSPKDFETLPSASLCITLLQVTEPSQRLFALAGIFIAKEYQRIYPISEKKTEPNQAPETTICTVTDRAPSSTLRASADRVSP